MIRIRLSFITLLLLAPAFWWIIFQPQKLFSEWIQVGKYVSRKTQSIFSEEKILRIGELRHDETSRLYYNKVTLVVDQVFDLVSFASPRMYFQSGDGTPLSPPGVEPVAVILFPFWVLGISLSVKTKNKLLIYWFAFLSLAFIAGIRNFAYLAPVLFLNIYFALVGIKEIISKKWEKRFLILFSTYSIYLLGRALWLFI